MPDFNVKIAYRDGRSRGVYETKITADNEEAAKEAALDEGAETMPWDEVVDVTIVPVPGRVVTTKVLLVAEFSDVPEAHAIPDTLQRLDDFRQGVGDFEVSLTRASYAEVNEFLTAHDRQPIQIAGDKAAIVFPILVHDDATPTR